MVLSRLAFEVVALLRRVFQVRDLAIGALQLDPLLRDGQSRFSNNASANRNRLLRIALLVEDVGTLLGTLGTPVQTFAIEGDTGRVPEHLPHEVAHRLRGVRGSRRRRARRGRVGVVAASDLATATERDRRRRLAKLLIHVLTNRRHVLAGALHLSLDRSRGSYGG